MIIKGLREVDPVMYGAPQELSLRVRNVVPSLDKRANKVARVEYGYKKVSEIAKEALDPDLINAQVVITEGLFMPVENMAHLLDKTDIATLDEASEKFSGPALDYIEQHKAELFPEPATKE